MSYYEENLLFPVQNQYYLHPLFDIIYVMLVTHTTQYLLINWSFQFPLSPFPFLIL